MSNTSRDRTSQIEDDIASEIERLNYLLQRGVLSKSKFDAAKRKLLGLPPEMPSAIDAKDGHHSSGSEVSVSTSTGTGSAGAPMWRRNPRATYIAVGLGVVVLALGFWYAEKTTSQVSQESQTQTAGNPSQVVPVQAALDATPASIATAIDTLPARASEPIAAPTINIGDSYTYETTTTDSNGKITTSETIREVTAINGDRVTVTATNAKSGKARTLIYDHSWNIVETGENPDEGLRYDPPIKYFDFPLTTGKKWTARSTETDKKTGKTRQYVIKGEVLGWYEELSRTFGSRKLDGLRVLLVTEVSDEEKRSTGKDISLYSPSIGRTVWSEITSHDEKGRNERKTLFLSSLSLTNGWKDAMTNPDEPSGKPRSATHTEASQAINLVLNRLGIMNFSTKEDFIRIFGSCDSTDNATKELHAQQGVVSTCTVESSAALSKALSSRWKDATGRLLRAGFDRDGQLLMIDVNVSGGHAALIPLAAFKQAYGDPTYHQTPAESNNGATSFFYVWKTRQTVIEAISFAKVVNGTINFEDSSSLFLIRDKSMIR